MFKGIDVSYANGIIDWNAVKNNIDFAILRCGYGQDRVSQDDSQFERNASECERLGIPYGVYLYSYADSVEKAASEADHVLRLIKGHKLSYPVYYDLEDAVTGRCSNDTIARMAKTFCDKIEDNGYWVGVYANLSWWNSKLTNPIFDKWVRWVAQWGVKQCEYKGAYGMWQYTSSGSVPGINGRVDMDYCYDNYPEKILGGVTTPKPETAPPSKQIKTYIVQRGDTLSGIAVKHGMTLARIKELNPQIKNPNLIYAGQTIYVEGTSSSTTTKTPYKGQKLVLKNVPLYATASTKIASGKVNGVYYLWDGVLVNGRYRITNSASRVGVQGQVTGFIDKEYV